MAEILPQLNNTKTIKEEIVAEQVLGMSFSFKSKNIIFFLSIFDKNDLPSFE